MRFQMWIGIATAFMVSAAPAPSDAPLAMVLVGRGPNQIGEAGVAIAIRANGVLLTSYRLIKDARVMQVRLKSGEVFDRVQLLGTDARRDIAAIRITGSLSVLPVATASQSAAGDAIRVISLSPAGEWSQADGSIAGYSMADEIPGAGQGYHVVRLTAAAGTGASGVVLDAQGNLLGLMTGPNFAVPADSVAGLAEQGVAKTFASGASLKLPVIAAAAPVKQAAVKESAPKPDRRALLRDLKSIYVDAESVKSFDAGEMKMALFEDKIFQRLNLEIVDDRDAADGVLTIRQSLKTDYPFELTSRNNQLLLRGTALGYTGEAGARSLALLFSQMVNEYRPRAEQAGRPDPAKLPADPDIGFGGVK